MTNQWAERQLQLFRFDFDEADKDKSGSLSPAEIQAVLKSRGFNGGDEEIKAIFQHLDGWKDNSISREEFTDAIRALPKMTVREFCLRKIFQALDKDGNGSLTAGEVLAATRKEFDGMDVDNLKLFDLLSALSKDEDSKLDYEEFLQNYRMESEKMILREIFTKLDKDKSGYLTRQELYESFKSDFELKLSMEKMTELIMHLAKDDDQKISYEEFIQIWQNGLKKK